MVALFKIIEHWNSKKLAAFAIAAYSIHESQATPRLTIYGLVGIFVAYTLSQAIVDAVAKRGSRGDDA